MTQRLPVPELFINEDVSKPENRTNLALFGVLLVPGVRAWLLERLALPADSIVYPPQNVAGGRPDFVVVGPDDTVVGWIEVELGGEDQGQLVQYRARHAEPVRSIVGPTSAGGDLSLEEIADVLSGPRFQGLDRQQTTNVGVFIALVGAMAGRPASFAYADPTEEVRGRRLVRALRDGLGSMLQYGTPPVTPGTAQVSTITQKGWTLKVSSKAASGGNVTLFLDQAAGREDVRVPSRTCLLRCLPTAPDRVERYAALCKDLGIDIAPLGEAQSLAVAETKVLAEIDRLVACVRDLATVYSGGTLSQ